jgi:hypothetical protein
LTSKLAWEPIGRVVKESASYPTLDRVAGDLRLYFARRDDRGRSEIHHKTLSEHEPLQVKSGSTQPLFDLGPPGTFDADGHAPRWVVEATDGSKLMYLIGWNRSTSVPYHLAIGCARSLDQGLTWTKLAGPVLDRSSGEPFFCTSPCVMVDSGVYRMWYCGCLGWESHEGKLEPIYRVHHAESSDGLHWRRTPHVCIDQFPGGDAIGWPVVWKEEDHFRMLFSYRGRAGFREDPAQAYRIGSAISNDGLDWELRNDEVHLERSGEAWDSVMTCYASPIGGLLFYNGNGFGATGIGVARKIVIADKKVNDRDRESILDFRPPIREGTRSC